MESKKETHHVREAVKDDCARIMELIKMLARHKKLDDKVAMNTETLMRDGFPENGQPSFKCLVSSDDNNKISGYLIYYYTYSTWEAQSMFLLNIYVDPQFRRIGIGRKLIRKFAQIANDEKIARIDFCTFTWNQVSICFHQSLGAVNLTDKEGWNIFLFNKNCIRNLANNTMELKNGTHHVREAVKDDCHQIMELIKMLARYENMEDSVKIDAETLMRDGFPENGQPKFKCIVPHDDNNKISGYLLYYYTYSTLEGRCIYMEDIFVDPKFRRMGIGKKMITKLTQIAYSDDIACILLSILNWNQLSIDFHHSIGAINLTEKDNIISLRFDGNSIQSLATESKHF